MISKRGELIKNDIYSVLTTGAFTALSFIITELINLVPTWDLDKIQQAGLTVLFTFLVDLAKKYAKVTNY